MQEIADELNVHIHNKNRPAKSIAERLVVKMFGSDKGKLREIETFNKLGIIPKTVVQNYQKKRTEDMKFESIDFDEWTDKSISFENSYIYNFFLNPILLIIFRETDKETPLLETVFKGFKRLTLDEDILQSDLNDTWNRVRWLVWNNDVKMETMHNKKGQIMITQRTKLPKMQNNLPKSSEYLFFLRGTGSNAKNKTLDLNGVQMYQQYVWIKGSYMMDLINSIEYI
ncbi:hypothetical protein [Companilactobacillus muriivasis]|uniref:hypothetical protein n=1 Tax=Companilactobacillus muriivasis TaxID=3081444 RepID=UPI0030C6DE10